MNKQLIQKLISNYNDYHKDEMIYILVETNSIIYNCYDKVCYGNKYVTFIDEDAKHISLEYKDIIGVKVRVI